MALDTIYIDATPGQHWVEDMRLSDAVEIMGVEREGKPQVLITSGTPVGKECIHNGPERRIYFDATIPFTKTGDTGPNGQTDFEYVEVVTILYKY